MIIQGNLLYYVSNNIVYDNANVAFINGTGVKSNSLAPNPVKAVFDNSGSCPKPGSSNHYLFTSIKDSTGMDSVLWHEINPVTKTVISKNNLISNSGGAIEVVPSSVAGNFWLILGKLNSVDVYPITSGGIGAPVNYALPAHYYSLSGSNPAGTWTNTSIPIGEYKGIRQVKRSFDCRKIAFAGRSTYVGNFNPTTGVLSSLEAVSARSNSVEWASGTNAFLYIVHQTYSGHGYTYLPFSTEVFQVALSMNNYHFQVYSNTTVDPTSGTPSLNGIVGLELGPDGKIYFYEGRKTLTGYYLNSLKAINNPNLLRDDPSFSINNAVGGNTSSKVLKGWPNFATSSGLNSTLVDTLTTIELMAVFAPSYTVTCSSQVNVDLGCLPTGTTVKRNGTILSGTTIVQYNLNPINLVYYWGSCPGADSTIYTLNFTPVSPNPPVVSSIQDTLFICSGSQTTLSASGCPGGTIRWYNGGSLLGTGTTFVYNGVLSDRTVQAKCWDGACESSGVNVFIDYAVIPTNQNAGLDKNICIPQSTNTTIGTLNQNSNYTYNWSPQSSLSPYSAFTDINKAIVVASPSVTTTYFLTITDMTSMCQKVDDVTVTVNNQPNVTLTASQNPMCSGENITFTATHQESSTQIAYIFFVNTTIVQSSYSPIFIPTTPLSNGQIVHVYAGGSGCYGRDTVNVNIVPCGTIGGTVFFDTDNNNTQSVGEVSASGGAPTNLNTLPGGSGVIVILYNASTNLSVASTATNTSGNYGFTNIPAGDYYIVFSNIPNGYTGSQSNIGGNDAVDSDGLNTGSFTFNGSNNFTTDLGLQAVSCSGSITSNRIIVTCTNTSATLTASNGVSYAWNTGANTSSIQVTPTATTSYTVTITNSIGCKAVTSITISVDQAAPTGNAGVDQTLGCGGGSATVTATGGASYSWNTGSSSSVLTGNVTNTTTFTVTVTGSNGCTSVDQVTVVVPVCGTIGGTVFFDTDNNNTQSVGRYPPQEEHPQI
ncbi:MAG: hypothetical protein IPQ04_10715 [Saprospiraceae bacterium]|nr:hypothetical protein [Saprospiraceae bacterium]